jgi:hypothetical protein
MRKDIRSWLHRSRSRASIMGTVAFMCVISMAACGARSITGIPTTPTRVTLNATLTTRMTATPSAAARDALARWLTGVPCRPPCWEGITPGQTTADEAVKLLQHNPSIATAEQVILPAVKDYGKVIWTWREGDTGGSASFHPGQAPLTIYETDVGFSQPLQLREVIQAYGDPSHVIATAGYNPDHGSGRSRNAVIVYRTQGFALTIDPDIRADTLVHVVKFFPATSEGLTNTFPEVAEYPDLLVAWQGVQDFAFYCRTPPQSNACPDR